VLLEHDDLHQYDYSFQDCDYYNCLRCDCDWMLGWVHVNRRRAVHEDYGQMDADFLGGVQRYGLYKGSPDGGEKDGGLPLCGWCAFQECGHALCLLRCEPSEHCADF